MFTPKALSEALQALEEADAHWVPLAGGTDLMARREDPRLLGRRFLNIYNLKELRCIEVSQDFVRIGSLTTFTEILENEGLKEACPLLWAAASEFAVLAIRNRATVGGNLVNASPAADSAPALLASDAVIEVESLNSTRRIPMAEFYQGYQRITLRNNELLKAVILPRRQTSLQYYYRKVGPRRAQAISKVSFAGRGRMDGGRALDLRLAFGSVAAIPLRAAATEALLEGKRLDRKAIQSAKQSLACEIAPIDDIRSSREYRLRVSLNLLEDFLLSLGAN